MLDGYTLERNREGNSAAVIHRCVGGGEVLYLKAERSGGGLGRECEVTRWLESRLPVPKVRYFGERDGWEFMLMTAMDGVKAGLPDDTVRPPWERTIGWLADGLGMVQGVDVTDCPYAMDDGEKFDKVLENAEANFHKIFVEKVTHKYAEMELIGQFRYGRQTDRPFDTAAEMREWLSENRPQGDRCFTHGDFGLTNTFVDGDRVAGFIDIGGGGVYNKWRDIATCVRSIGYHSRSVEEKARYLDVFFGRLGVAADWDKINYHIWFSRMKGKG
jgi:aminoglycoside phosphotransferase